MKECPIHQKLPKGTITNTDRQGTILQANKISVQFWESNLYCPILELNTLFYVDKYI